MNKSILVINTPNNCNECVLKIDSYAHYELCAGTRAKNVINSYCKVDMKPTLCPLKPIPEEDNSCTDDEYYDGWGMRYNACLKKILGD